MMYEGELRYKDPYSVPAPKWATAIAISSEICLDEPELGNTWWFINEEARKWSHYNSPELFPTSFDGFRYGNDIKIHPLKISLENK